MTRVIIMKTIIRKRKTGIKKKIVFGSLTGYKRYGKIDCQGKKGGVVFGLAW